MQISLSQSVSMLLSAFTLLPCAGAWKGSAARCLRSSSASHRCLPMCADRKAALISALTLHGSSLLERALACSARTSICLSSNLPPAETRASNRMSQVTYSPSAAAAFKPASTAAAS
jgi:hypothetical protein